MKPDTAVINLPRRAFLRASLSAGGALLLGPSLYAPGIAASDEHAASADVAVPLKVNPWLTISADNTITLIIDRVEMGQGVLTALSMLVAEELNSSPERFNTEFAPVAQVYNDPEYRMQTTGGSTSVPRSWERYRQVGAAARLLLQQAAAKAWQLEPADCEVKDYAIHNRRDQRQLSFAQVLSHAVELDAPDLDDVELKPRDAYRFIGQPVRRMDAEAKLNGRAKFGIDVQVPQMRIASLRQAPVFGARPEPVNIDAIRQLVGVEAVIVLDDAVAVVADNYWHARRALDKLEIHWTGGLDLKLNDADIFARWEKLEQEEAGQNAREEGDGADALQGDATVQAVYQLPWLAHATMEPMNCTAHVQADRCDIWVPTQAPTASREAAARITGLDHDDIHVHTTFLGGGFGRRAQVDFVEQAVTISQRSGVPVKLIWSREEDIQHDFYRPANHNVLKARLDEQGKLVAWQHRIVSPPLLSSIVPDFAAVAMPSWLSFGVKDFIGAIAGKAMSFSADPTAIEGAANLPYAIEHISVDYIADDPGIPIGFWRSVGSSQNAFVVESFIDELAHAAKADPYQFRRRMLKEKPRHLRVLDQVVDAAKWKQPLQTGRFRGLAIHESFNSVVAQVAEISVANNEVRVHRVDCAIDCGLAVNPNIIRQQMESAVIYGLGAALKNRIDIQGGRVVQSNFHDFPIIRQHEAPEVTVHILPSDEPPTGVGEPGVPPIAPAVANAVFMATGKRVRSLPIDLQSMSAMT